MTLYLLSFFINKGIFLNKGISILPKFICSSPINLDLYIPTRYYHISPTFHLLVCDRLYCSLSL
nr:MAG TPA: hypothetical protein [Caudoviricetes sp.]